MADQTEQPPVESGAPAEATPDVDPVDPGESTELDDAVAPGKDEDILSKKVTLADLSAKGATLYAHKNYEEAAEIFSEASVLQAEINGETAPENAEVLFHYGRSLFKVGQSKSDVLGGSAPDAKPPKGNALPKPAATGDKTADEKASSSKEDAADKGPSANKPLFQFTGDEHLDGSDDDDEAPEEGNDEEEDEDDLATAFEILDLARVCYLKRLEQLTEEEAQNGKGKEAAGADSASVRHVKERLADTHDALSEIALENERYPNAIEDGRKSLNYKLELYPEESEIIAEAHYKLSLSLEFASVTTSGDDGTTAKREDMDQGLRDEAVKEMELAIKSFNLKLKNKEAEVATMASPEDNELERKAIAEMKELIADMEQRLTDLRSDPIDTKNLMGQDANPLGGIFGAALGENPEEAKARIEAATKTATDLSGMVRKKKPKAEEAAPAPAAPAAPESDANGKRKAELDPPEDGSAKRAKTEELNEA